MLHNPTRVAHATVIAADELVVILDIVDGAGEPVFKKGSGINHGVGARDSHELRAGTRNRGVAKSRLRRGNRESAADSGICRLRLAGSHCSKGMQCVYGG